MHRRENVAHLKRNGSCEILLATSREDLQENLNEFKPIPQ